MFDKNIYAMNIFCVIKVHNYFLSRSNLLYNHFVKIKIIQIERSLRLKKTHTCRVKDRLS